jgi:hypothetical protein
MDWPNSPSRPAPHLRLQGGRDRRPARAAPRTRPHRLRRYMRQGPMGNTGTHSRSIWDLPSPPSQLMPTLVLFRFCK